MDVLATNAGAERARTRWLIRLRWMAVLGVVSALLVAGPVLQILEKCRPIWGLVIFLALWNTANEIRFRRGRLQESAKAQLTLDLLALSAMLWFSGGLRNPFSVFLVIQVILGAILLPRAPAHRLGFAAVLLILILGVAEVLCWLPPIDDIYALGARGTLPIWAVAVAILISTLVALSFASGIMGELRDKAEEAERYFEEARRERLRLRNIVRNVGAGLVLLDKGGHVLWLNRAAGDLFGPLAAGSPFRIPGEEASWPDPERLAGEESEVREWRGSAQCGHPRVHQMTATAIRGPDGLVDQIAIVLTDITDRRAAESQLQRTEKLAALGRLAAGVAHEINTPLGSVSIQTQEARAMLERVFAGDLAAKATVAEFLDDIRGETDRISGLVRRLLDAGHPGVETPQLVDASHIISDVVRLISVRAGKSAPLVRTEFAQTCHRLVTAPDRLRQVLLNLLDNALDAVRDGGGEVLVQTEGTDSDLVIRVIDEGLGIAPENLPRVFDPFFTTKDVGEGTGLGLYVSYEIVKNLGGQIDIRSRPGAGTTVLVRLPRAKSKSSSEASS